MKRTLVITLLVISCVCSMAQTQTLTLEDCHSLALKHNNNLKISQEKVYETDALKNVAFSEMLPRLSANGTYLWNQKSVKLLSDDQVDAINHIGTTVQSNLTPTLTSLVGSLMQTDPTVAQALMQAIGNSNLEGSLNSLGQELTDALDLDMSNVWAGAVTVTQPVFMGGKLVELYKTARAASEMAQINYDKDQEDLMIQVDEAYWRVISVTKKQQLAQQYADLLDTMLQNVQAMKEADMATDADVTKVRVKLNEAQMSLAKANSGLALSKMLLYQMCGLDLNGNYQIVESRDLNKHTALDTIDMAQVLNSRNEIKLLEKTGEMANSAVKIARAGLMPNLVVTGSYVVSNPNLFNGLENMNEFGGMFTVGAALNVPIAHPSAIFSLKVAKHKRNEVQYQIDEAREKIQLQVNKLNYELDVANTKLTQAQTNLTNAQENLDMAQESFKAGMISSSDLLAAQTAWLSASSELLDTEIEVQMDYRYLNQALGK